MKVEKVNKIYRNECRFRLFKAIEKRGCTRKELCISIGITQQALNSYLSGYRAPKASVLAPMAEYLGVTMEWLMGLKEEADVR